MSDRADDSSPSGRNAEPTLDDFWAFRTMLTPLLVHVVFWLGALGCIGYGVYQILQARTGGPWNDVDSWNKLAVLRAAAWIIFGPMAVRLLCEVAILFFRINETLTEIKNKLR
jgi:hypothetical protein